MIIKIIKMIVDKNHKTIIIILILIFILLLNACGNNDEQNTENQNISEIEQVLNVQKKINNNKIKHTKKEQKLIEYYKNILDLKNRKQDKKLIKKDSRFKPIELLTLAQIENHSRVLFMMHQSSYLSSMVAQIINSELIFDKKISQNISQNISQQNSILFLHKIVWKTQQNPNINNPNINNILLPKNTHIIQTGLNIDLPDKVKNLDVIFNLFSYHSYYRKNLNLDVDKINQLFFDRLKKGGRMIVIDHNSQKNMQNTHSEIYYRIEKNFLIQQLQKVGFVLDKERFYMRNPNDTKDFPYYLENDIHTDIFILKFIKS